MASIRDKRPADWFWMNKAVIDDYGAKIGVHGVALYALLAKCANCDGHAIPSLRYMAKKLSISTNTVLRYLEILTEHHLIESHYRKSDEGDFTSTEYILLNIKSLSDGGVSLGETPVSAGEPRVSASETPVSGGEPRVSPSATRVSHLVQHGVSPSETEQEDLNKKNLNKEESPLTPQGEEESSRKKRVIRAFPKEEKAQTVLMQSILDAAFYTWQTAKYPDADIPAQWDCFSRYCLAKDARYADFRAAFQNSFEWERSPAQRGHHGKNGRGASSTTQLEAWAKQKEQQL